MDYIKEARKYLRDRLAAELSFQNNLSSLIDKYAYKLVDIAYSSNVPPTLFTFEYNDIIREKVDKVIEELHSVIEDITEILAVSTHAENKDKILTYINRDIDGKNFYDRLDGHINTFRKETEGIIAAALLVGTSISVLKQNLNTYKKMPYQNPIFIEAIKLNQGRASALVNKGIHYGVGISNSAYNSINNLGKFTIGDAWMYDGHLEMDAQGAIGYVGHRNSSFGCQICDDEANRFHPLSGGMVYPMHQNCACFVTPVFRNDL